MKSVTSRWKELFIDKQQYSTLFLWDSIFDKSFILYVFRIYLQNLFEKLETEMLLRSFAVPKYLGNSSFLLFVFFIICFIWHDISDMFYLSCPICHVLSDIIYLTCSIWHVLSGMFDLTCSIWHVLSDMFYLACSIRHVLSACSLKHIWSCRFFGQAGRISPRRFSKDLKAGSNNTTASAGQAGTFKGKVSPDYIWLNKMLKCPCHLFLL